ncbi:MAG: GH92 family glycosyl hydrolase [Acidobacteriota bacterium]|nr:MAG: GH92 family glycosyl hydrolase [Acidobacteriota bacterium]
MNTTPPYLIFSRLFSASFFTLFLLSTVSFAIDDPARWVNPFIGTGGHGHTFPGATMPFGMVQLSPDTRIDNWDGSSGYHYSDDIIYGFSHTHLSGTGIPDYCDILFAPYISDGYFWEASPDDTKKGFASKFSHDNEKAEPGYYSVKLDDEDILAEMTATERVGFHRYTFPKGTEEAKIALDLRWRDEVLDSGLKIVGDRRVEGFRRSRSWAKDQIVYFSAEFSMPFVDKTVLDRVTQDDVDVIYWTIDPDSIGNELEGKDLISNFTFDLTEYTFPPSDNKPLLLKVGISAVSIEGARKNLEAEVPHWDFDKVRKDARAAWNKELSKIEVSGGTDAEMTNFYTALYHTMIAPNVYNDVDGNYRGLDRKIHNIADQFKVQGSKFKDSPGGEFKIQSSKFKESDSDDERTSLNLEPGTSNSRHYTVFSLWDTFRATHPLYTIIDEKRTVEFINTFIRMYEQGGKLPVWELAGNETDTMIGYHAVSVIADAMAKGIEGFDYEKAYEAARHSSGLDIEGLDAFRRRGYISMEDEQESVSRTLEYAYNSYCLYVIAERLLDKKYPRTAETESMDLPPGSNDPIHRESRHFIYQARYYKNLFDTKTGFMRPKQNGNWISPFSPNEVTFHFTEANSWQYTFHVTQDVGGLMSLFGGKEKFAAKLDELFTTESKLEGRDQPDITGLIGQYAHGNEPSHHIAYLYNFAGQPWKTQDYVRKIMEEFYKPTPDGLIGNEDCGQMSAWYVLSALGFYQVNPGDPDYALGTPIFKEARIHLENGKTFSISKRGDGIYLGSVKLNGSPRRAARFSHEELMDGGRLEISMSREPVKNWFTSTYEQFIYPSIDPVPTVEGSRVFEGSTEVVISAPLAGQRIYFTTDGTDPDWSSKLYEGPFVIHDTTQIKAISITRHARSQIVESILHKMPHDWDVEIRSKYSNQYTGGGPKGLIDGLRGTTNFASGEWQGYQGQDFEAVIDLKRPTRISKLGGGFLQVARSWIWMPRSVTFEISDDGKTWRKAAEIETDFPEREMEHTIRDYVKTIDPVTARYVRVKAVNFGKIPAWHPGAGFDAYIFVDEIIVE